MSVSSGFFNSVNGDRKYDAEELGAIFDGILKDGVYSTIGGAFAVSVSEGMFIQVDSGRAWFDHTWTLNDAPIILEVIEPPLYMSRYDAVVLEINKTETGRTNQIKIINGLASDTPVKPEMIKTDTIIQYPLAYILVEDNITEILPEKIEVTVGTDECPFCSGILQQVTIDELLAAWQQEFDTCLDSWKSTETTQFEEWASHLADELDDNQAAHLQAEVDGIWMYLDSIGRAEEEEF